MSSFEPVHLTELEENTLSLVFSSAFRRPTLDQISGWSTFGAVGSARDKEAARRRKAGRALSSLEKKGLVTRQGDRWVETEFGTFMRDWLWGRPKRIGSRETQPSDMLRFVFAPPPSSWREQEPVVVYATRLSEALDAAISRLHDAHRYNDLRMSLITRLSDLRAEIPLGRRCAQNDLTYARGEW